VLSPTELRDRLKDELEPMASGPRDLPDRQRTLRSTIEWSHALLDDDERRLFAVLSVFPSATVESVREVAAAIPALAGIDILATLAALVDKSLLRSEMAGHGRRVAMLGTIRRYAAERLAQEPQLAQDSRAAHAEYYTRLAATSRGPRHVPQESPDADRLAPELDNLEGAWSHYLERRDLGQLNVLAERLWLVHEGRGWYHRVVSLTNDLLDVLRTAKPTPEQGDDEVTLRLVLARALLAIRGYTPEVEHLYQEALDVSQARQSGPRRLAVLRSLGSFYLYRSQVDRTAEIGQQLLDLAEQTGDARIEIEGQMMVGPATAFMGDAPGGLRHLERAMELFDPTTHRSAPFRLGPSPGVAAPVVSAMFHWWLGRPDTARALVDRAIELADELRHPYTAAWAHFHAGVLDVWNRDYAGARRRAEQVLTIATEHDYRIWNALGMVLAGVGTAGLDDPKGGADQAEAGVALYEGIPTPPVFWPVLLSLRADALARAGRLSEAERTLDQALSLAGVRNWLSAAFVAQRGEVLLAGGRASEAVAALRQAASEAAALGSRMVCLRALTRLTVAGEGAERNGARTRLRSVLDELTEGSDHVLIVEARGALA
jgi:tetratricopeptide (TPR) repeat protein